MEGESGRWKLHPLGDSPGGKSVRTRFDQQPEDAQPRLLRQGFEGDDSVARFHISDNMEI
jgi:hypothetical protein